MNQPRKRRPKLKKVNISARDQWQKIVSSVDTDHIPARLLNSVVINLIDGTKVRLDIKELLAAGNDPDELDDNLRSKFKDLDNIIHDVDFYIDLDTVANTVQPITDQILKNL